MEKIIEILKQLKLIEPEQEFKTRSLNVILGAPQIQGSFIMKKFFESVKFGATLSLACFFILVVIGGISVLREISPANLASLNTETINKEYNASDIRITLSEINYYSDSLDKVAMALTEAIKNKPEHLDSVVIEQEIEGIGASIEEETKNLDDILNDLSQ
ncbi:MAG: hypothetical protein PHP03_02605 [Candidatus Pacebacteria bacterium]|nr:hypothetical protein [Candidatus Paceibacterota bacterium]